jgi:UDP-N-acetylmuramoyl-L-alanyl-D-glutamate--2,6-diaminopimelate ligase
MKLTDLLFSADLPILNFNDVNVSGICPDSRRIKGGDMYIALEGLSSDGHAYIGDAVKRGAVCAAVSKKAFESGILEGVHIPMIVCEDTRRAMSYLYSTFYGEPQKKMKVIGVTGTNGKTSVATLVYRILSASGRKCALLGTLGCFLPSGRTDNRGHNENANMTTPDPEELYAIMHRAVCEGVEYLVMEVSSHALALSKVDPIEFEVAVFTNLTPEHLDLHGDMEEYFSAKARLFDACRLAVINYDDKYGRMLADRIDRRNGQVSVMLCSMEGRECDRICSDIQLHGKNGIEYKLLSRDMRLRLRSPLVGEFNVMNTAEAALVCHALGVSHKDIKDTVASFSGVSGRLERVKLPVSDLSVYIDYAHTPDALENLIRCVRGFATREQRIVVLFGCGGDRDKSKRPLMGRVALSMADSVIITSDNSRSERAEDIINDILSCVGDGRKYEAQYTVIKDRKEAIEYAVRCAKRSDIILLCGKGHEEYEIDSLGKRYFSEKEIVIRAVEKYRSDRDI